MGQPSPSKSVTTPTSILVLHSPPECRRYNPYINMDSSSIESTQHENAWRRGWSDTKAAVTSWWFVLADAALGLLTGVVVANWKGTLWGAGAAVGVLLGFAVLLLWNLYRAPIRQRNEAGARQEQMEQLRPEIGTELEARVLHSESGFWLYSPRAGFVGEPSELRKHHLLEVTNPSGVTITDYYAKFREFRDSRNRTIDDLMGYELYWYEAGPDLPEKRMSVPSKKSRHLHIFTTTDIGDELGISQVVSGEYRLWYKRLDSTPSGEYYTAILEIGSLSEKVSIPPVDVELKITYQGNHALSAEIKVGQLQAKP